MTGAALLLLAAQAAAPTPLAPNTMPSPRVAVSAKPIVDPATWVTADDYPPSAMRAGEQGRVTVQFTVARSGLVSDCRVTTSSGSTALDEASCRVVQLRARFKPAQDDHGQPIAITMSRSFVWALPDDASGGAPIATGVEITHITLSKGRVTGCRVQLDGQWIVNTGTDCARGFSNELFLNDVFGPDLARAATVDVTSATLAGDLPAPAIPAGATRIVLAESIFSLATDGSIISCASRVANVLRNFPLDYCASPIASHFTTFGTDQRSVVMRLDATITFAK